MIYLDSCLLIYAVEDAGDLGDRARHLVKEHEAEGWAISSLVKMECLIGPIRRKDLVTERRFERAFSDLIVVPLLDGAFVQAARLRAEHGIKAVDALHLAGALQAGCSALWTNDRRLASAAGDFARVLEAPTG